MNILTFAWDLRARHFSDSLGRKNGPLLVLEKWNHVVHQDHTIVEQKKAPTKKITS